MNARAFAITIALASFGAAGCGLVAGLSSDYQLADASTGSDADSGGDAMATHDAAVSPDGSDATVDVVTRDAVADASDAGADAIEAGLLVPPSDPANVACGSVKCPVATKVCCEETAMSSCTSSTNPSCNGGVIAECDETANCGPTESCCLTSVRAYGLETRCNGGACGGRGWQSCRTNAECPNGQTCVAWTCAGRTVATCNGFGSDAGCN